MNTYSQTYKKTLLVNHIITFGCQEYSLTENSNVDSPIISGGKVIFYPGTVISKH